MSTAATPKDYHEARQRMPREARRKIIDIAMEAPDMLHEPESKPEAACREHPIPEDSILAEYRGFARTVTDAPDCWIAAPILALCGKLMTPGVHIDFGGYKPLTIFNFIVGPAGMRKSITFAPARAIAKRLLAENETHEGNASDSALFDVFHQQPHRAQLEDEANGILNAWANQSYGREASARYLALYDGSGWKQTFRRSATKEDATAEKRIERATLSLCLGSTFGVSRLAGIDVGSGLRRRFGYYVATRSARDLDWPASLDGGEMDQYAAMFKKLSGMKGVFNRGSFTSDAWEEWRGIQTRNRERIAGVTGFSAAEEALAASLNEFVARTLKLAIIFQGCRWAEGSVANPYVLTPDVLRTAEAHQVACIDALIELDTAGRQAQTDDTAEVIHAKITALLETGTEALLTKSELNARYASHPGRAGAVTPAVLYNEIIPHLMKQGFARIADKTGKKVTYAFIAR